MIIYFYIWKKTCRVLTFSYRIHTSKIIRQNFIGIKTPRLDNVNVPDQTSFDDKQGMNDWKGFERTRFVEIIYLNKLHRWK